MKTLGLITFVVGLAFTVFNGFNYIFPKTLVEMGDVKITHDEKHNISWSPIVGVFVMVTGGAIYLLSSKQRR